MRDNLSENQTYRMPIIYGLNSSIFDLLPIGVCLSDACSEDFPLVYVNDKFCLMSGYDKNEVIGKNCRFLQGSDREQVDISKIRMGLARQEEISVTLRNYKKDGTMFWNQIHISPVFDSGVLKYFIAAQIDVTDKVNMIKQLEFQATHDPLTGLYNRIFIESKLDELIAKSQDFGLIFLDFDKFKPINDEYGHLIGDEILKIIGLRLSSFAFANCYVGRMGGDEFIIIVSELIQSQQLYDIASKLKRIINQPVIVNQLLEFKISVSMGIAIYPLHGDNIRILLSKADEAMYAVKNKKSQDIFIIS